MNEALRSFRSLVNERGESLRKLSFQDLRQMDQPIELFTVANRKARLSIIVNQIPGGILVVVQGFLKKRFLPLAYDVALDGFYKYADETIAPMTREDMYSFD